jgi:hypothetical protein
MNENEQPQDKGDAQPTEQSGPTEEQVAAANEAVELGERLMGWADEALEKQADSFGPMTSLQVLALSISLLFAVKDEFDMELISTLMLTRLAQVIKSGKALGLSDETILFGRPTTEDVEAEFKAGREKKADDAQE